MDARGSTVLYQIFGAIIGGIRIFLPGLLLIYFVYPVWTELKQIRAIRILLKGINAVAGGLITIAVCQAGIPEQGVSSSTKLNNTTANKYKSCIPDNTTFVYLIFFSLF